MQLTGPNFLTHDDAVPDKENIQRSRWFRSGCRIK